MTKPITIHTDSNVSISLISNPHNRISDTLANNIDLILEIRSVISLPGPQFKFVHIASHQDKRTAFEYLPTPAKMNVLADTAADLQYSHPIHEHHIDMPHLPAQLISISNPTNHLLSHVKDEMCCLHRDSPTEQYLAESWKIAPKLFSNIDWIAIQKTFQNQPRFSGKFTKTMHMQWDTTARKRRWSQTKDATCPLCHRFSETPAHVLQCNHSTVRNDRRKASIELSKSLDKAHTAPTIVKTISKLVHEWTCSSTISIPERRTDKLEKSVRKAIKSQKK